MKIGALVLAWLLLGITARLLYVNLDIYRARRRDAARLRFERTLLRLAVAVHVIGGDGFPWCGTMPSSQDEWPVGHFAISVSDARKEPELITCWPCKFALTRSPFNNNLSEQRARL
jgi:hypothetical protein